MKIFPEKNRKSSNPLQKALFDGLIVHSNPEKDSVNPAEINNKKLTPKEKTVNFNPNLAASNWQNADNLAHEEKFNAARGYGFAAERANDQSDRLHFKDAVIKGDDFAKNGADRLVDGISIQSKYCKTGEKCIDACFEKGQFRYFDADGKPMQIEVPADKYDEAVKSLEKRIENNQLEGVTKPESAKDIVRKGNYTYEEAVNITKAGTIDSVLYDSKNGVLILKDSAAVLGLNFTINFTKCKLSGMDTKTALKSAVKSELKYSASVIGTALSTGQLNKLGLNEILKRPSEEIVRAIGNRNIRKVLEVLDDYGIKILDKNIYGEIPANVVAPMAKILRNNVITNSLSMAVSAAPDLVDTFKGRISSTQLAKNLTQKGIALGGAALGSAAAGAAAGSIVPGIGTAAGGAAGAAIGLVGSIAGSKAGEKVAENVTSFIKDDKDKMTKIIDDKFDALKDKYFLTQKEAKSLDDSLRNKLSENPELFKDMYASTDKEAFATELIKSEINELIADRPLIRIPDMNEVIDSVKSLISDLIGDMETLFNNILKDNPNDITNHTEKHNDEFLIK